MTQFPSRYETFHWIFPDFPPLTFECDSGGEGISAELFVCRRLNQRLAACSAELIEMIVVRAVPDVRRRLKRRAADVRLEVLIDAAEQGSIAVITSCRCFDQHLGAVINWNAVAVSGTGHAIVGRSCDRSSFTIFAFDIFRFNYYVI